MQLKQFEKYGTYLDVDELVPEDVPPSNVLREHSDLMTWGHPEMMSRGRPSLTFSEISWVVNPGCPEDLLRTSSRGPSKHFSWAI